MLKLEISYDMVYILENQRKAVEPLNRLLDKLAITLICLIGFAANDSFTAPVIAFLFSVTASLAAQILTGRKSASCVIFISAAACTVMPEFFCALPLMIYDALWEKKCWLVLPCLTVFLRPDAPGPFQLIISFVGIIISVIIYLRVSKLEETVGKLTLLRDKIAEKSILLTEQNRRLSDAQDNEIHLAALKERNRIAREIHDNVGHMLTRSLLQSGALIVMNKDESLKEPLNSLKDTLDCAMTGIRESVHNLHDDSIDLKAVMLESVKSADSRFDVSFDYDAGENIPGKVKMCVAGVVKESLSNAVKHSSGNKISVVFREHPAFYQLMIKDNGKLKKISENGIGLKNMEERADSVGGKISFTPSEHGFTVFMSVPKKL